MKRFYCRCVFAVAAFFLSPFLLRRKSRVVRRIIIRATPADIFPFLNDLRNWPKWTEWSRLEEIHFSYEGPSSGVGAEQRWSSKRMAGVMRLVQSVPDEQVAYHTELGTGGYQYHVDGILTLESFGSLTRVTWLCRWDSGPNPYSRYKSLLMKWFIGRGFHAGLSNLKALLEHGAL